MKKMIPVICLVLMVMLYNSSAAVAMLESSQSASGSFEVASDLGSSSSCVVESGETAFSSFAVMSDLSSTGSFVVENGEAGSGSFVIESDSGSGALSLIELLGGSAGYQSRFAQYWYLAH